MSRICPKCGAENRDSAKFCLMCAHQLAPIRQVTPRMAAAMVRRRNRHRRGYPLEVPEIAPDNGFAPSAPFVTSTTIEVPPRIRHPHRGGSTGWFTAVGLGVVLIFGSLAWTAAANRASHNHAPLLAPAQIAASAQPAPQHPMLVSAQATANTQASSSAPPASAASSQTQTQTQTQPQTQATTHPAPRPDDDASTPPADATPAKPSAPDDSAPAHAQARAQPDSEPDVAAAPAEPASKARPARRHKPKPAPRPKAEKPPSRASASARPPAKGERIAAVASAPAPAAPHVLCPGDAISQTICLMRACDKPANAHTPECEQFQQRVKALRNNAGGNRPYPY